MTAKSIRICAVVALSENRVIGRAGGLPWHIPDDLKHARALTMGKPLIMGRKTYDSIGRPLPGRASIVITGTPASLPPPAAGKDYEGPHGVTSLDEALALAGKIAGDSGVDEIIIFGGGKIYEQALSITDRIHQTVVHQTIDGDTYFPALDEKDWRETMREDRDGFSFITLDRAR